MLFTRRHARMSDDRLVELVSLGDEKAFEELLSRHGDAVFAYARAMLGDEAEAGDMVQETFLRLYRSSERYLPSGRLRGYLLKITRNLVMDHLRKKRPFTVDNLPEIVDNDTPLRALERTRAARALFQAVEELPEAQRQAVVLRHASGLAYADIALAMDTTVSAVESLLSRARKKLKHGLKEHL